MSFILTESETRDHLFVSGHERSVTRFSVTNPAISFFSPKNGKVMFLESYAEMNQALLLERDTEVTRYQSQPISINYAKNRRYTPDFVEERNGFIVASEVKQSSKVLNEKEINKYACIHHWFEEQGTEFILRRVDHNDPVVKLQRRLYRFHSHDPLDLIEEKPSFSGSLNELIKNSDNENKALCQVYSGVFRGLIETEDYLLNKNSFIKWGAI